MASYRSSWWVSSVASQARYRSSVASISSSLAGVPHAVTQDDVYAGFFIPKGEFWLQKKYATIFTYAIFFSGATVIGNIWWAMFPILLE